MNKEKQLSIFKATHDHQEAVLDILFSAVSRLEKANLITWSRESLKKFISQAIDNQEVYIAYLGNKPAGTATLQWSDLELWGEQPNDAGYIHKLAVSEEFTGKGVGTSLVEWCENTIKKEQLSLSRLDCDATNSRINEYYQALGYKYVDTVGRDEIKLNLYQKKLA